MGKSEHVLFSAAPGDVIVVGPNGRLSIATDGDNGLLVSVVNCNVIRASVRTTALTEIRDQVFSGWDDTGTRRLDGGSDLG